MRNRLEEPRAARGRLVTPPEPRPGNLQTASIAWPLAEASREAALAIPTATACRNLIVGAIVQMGIGRYRGNERIDPGSLLSQPDPDTTWSATIGGTADDLLFYGRSYWVVLAFDGNSSEQNPRGFPVRARWLPYGDVSPEVDSQAGAYQRLIGYRIAGIDGIVPPDLVIRFDSSLPGILAYGARAIATANAIEAAARRFADVEIPVGVLENEGTELSPDEAAELVADFEAARLSNSVAFLQSIKYNRTALNAEDLQLIQARDRSDTEIARLFNVPVAMVAASPSGNTTALLYQNLASQLSLFVSNAVAPHLRTIEQTLSLPSVTPRGNSVAFDVQAFLRSDPMAAAQYAMELYAADLVSREESRGFLGIPASVDPSLSPGRI